jgi:hypothetical protein
MTAIVTPRLLEFDEDPLSDSSRQVVEGDIVSKSSHR